MTDEKYIYHKDIAEKKRTARGSFNRLSRTGKSRMKTPSDYLPKKERNKMNGEVKSYNLNAPMSWAEFRAMPKDIQAEYINGLIEKYSPTQTAVAKMLGVSYGGLNKHCRHELNIYFGFKGRPDENTNKEFWKWVENSRSEQQNNTAETPIGGSLVFADTSLEKALKTAINLITTKDLKRIEITWEAT